MKVLNFATSLLLTKASESIRMPLNHSYSGLSKMQPNVRADSQEAASSQLTFIPHATLKIGSAEQQIHVKLDTSNSGLLVKSDYCENCSTNGKFLQGDSTSWVRESDTIIDVLDYNYGFTEAEAYKGKDTVVLGDYSVAEFDFLVVANQFTDEGQPLDDVSGILGLARPLAGDTVPSYLAALKAGDLITRETISISISAVAMHADLGAINADSILIPYTVDDITWFPQDKASRQWSIGAVDAV
jgi:hypothetical protein